MSQYKIVNLDVNLDDEDGLEFVIHNGCLMQFDDHSNLMYAVIGSDGRIIQERNELETLEREAYIARMDEGEPTPYRGDTKWEYVEELDEESIQVLEKAFPKEQKAFNNFRKMNVPYTWPGYCPDK